jgi:protein phosphatase
MRFNISGFTDLGTKREINQDRILIQDSIYSEGLHYHPDLDNCFCFVADGIGGGRAGDFAAEFVLGGIRKKINSHEEYSQENLSQIFSLINSDLIDITISKPKFTGAGTTLVGLMIRQENFQVINAGDSQAYMLRNKNLIKLTEDQVFDPFQENSPLTSYFGGKQSELIVDFDTVLRDIYIGDLFLLSSDGLFKSLDARQIKAILANSKPVNEKASFLLHKSLEIGSEDNLSCILIEVIE